MQRAADAERALEELSGLRRGHLRIHASQTIANYWLPARLHRFRQDHPKLSLALTIGNTAQVVEAMIEGKSDLGLVEGEIEEVPLRRQSMLGDRLVLVVGSSHPWSKRRRVRPAELTETNWVLREPGSGTRQVFESAAKAMGIDPGALAVVLELPSNEAVRSAVEAGAGATVISELVVASSLRHGGLHAIALPLPRRDFTILRHPDRYQSRAVTAFIQMVEAEQGSPAPARVSRPRGGQGARRAPESRSNPALRRSGTASS